MKLPNPVLLLLLATGCAIPFSGRVGDPADAPPAGDLLAARCELHRYADKVTIAPGTSEELTVGPLFIPEGATTIHGVILGMEIRYAYAGDLKLFLHYDCENDGIYEASTPVEIGWACKTPGPVRQKWACPIELEGYYYFCSVGWDEVDKGSDSTVEQGQDVCSSLAIFDGCPRGGAFYISIIDQAQRGGSIASWTVYLDRPDAAEPS